MTANFFQTLKQCEVQYLLISGQAAVLYGAATFSEDIDIWLRPSAENATRFINALRKCGARYYKITPPLTPLYLLRGHGFHFLVPSAGKNDMFLDVMGVPPRVPEFTIAYKRSARLKTPWGILPVVGIPDLIELKKTQRLEDYPVISRLVLRYCSKLRKNLDRRQTYWAINHLFSLASLREFFQQHPQTIRHLDSKDMAVFRRWTLSIQRQEEPDTRPEQNIERGILRRITTCQQHDRLYWRNIIAELKRFRAEKLLLHEGKRV